LRDKDLNKYIKELELKRFNFFKDLEALKRKQKDRGHRKSKMRSKRKKQIILGGQDKVDKKGNLIDNFGENDADWDIYHEITEDSSEKEEEILKQIEIIENELKESDPFYYEKHIEQKTCLTKEDFFLEMSVDLIRSPEIFFQPPMIGVYQEGLTESIMAVL